jgi:hypothetical protein
MLNHSFSFLGKWLLLILGDKDCLSGSYCGSRKHAIIQSGVMTRSNLGYWTLPSCSTRVCSEQWQTCLVL